MVVINPVVGKGVAPELGGGDEAPVCFHRRAFERLRQERAHVGGGFRQFGREGLLAFQQGRIGLVALEERYPARRADLFRRWQKEEERAKEEWERCKREGGGMPASAEGSVAA